MTYILLLDGYTGYVRVPDHPELSFIDTVSGWTMSVLCRPDVANFPTTVSSSEGPLVGMLSKKWPQDGAREYEMLLFNDNAQRSRQCYCYFYQPNQSLGAGTYIGQQWTVGQWMNTTFTIDNVKDSIYKDGVFIRCDIYRLGTPSGNCVGPYLDFTPVPADGPSNLRIGAQNVQWENSSETGVLLGAIKDVRMFNRVLTNAEVTTLNTDMYNGTNNLASSNMILWHNYRLGNANDQSGHGHDGTLMNGGTPGGGNAAKFVSDGCVNPACQFTAN